PGRRERPARSTPRPALREFSGRLLAAAAPRAPAPAPYLRVRAHRRRPRRRTTRRGGAGGVPARLPRARGRRAGSPAAVRRPRGDDPRVRAAGGAVHRPARRVRAGSGRRPLRRGGAVRLLPALRRSRGPARAARTWLLRRTAGPAQRPDL